MTQEHVGDSSGRSIKAQLYDASGAALWAASSWSTRRRPAIRSAPEGHRSVRMDVLSGRGPTPVASVTEAFQASRRRYLVLPVSGSVPSLSSTARRAPHRARPISRRGEGDRFVITWTDAVGDEVMARRYDASGNRVFCRFCRLPLATASSISWARLSAVRSATRPATASRRRTAGSSISSSLSTRIRVDRSGSLTPRASPTAATSSPGRIRTARRGTSRRVSSSPGARLAPRNFSSIRRPRALRPTPRSRHWPTAASSSPGAISALVPPTSRRRRSTPRAQPSARSFSSIPRPHSTRRRLQSSGSPMVACRRLGRTERHAR